MKNSTGVVMQTDKKYAFIMTNSGEFLKIKLGNAMPNIGEIYTGELVKEKTFYKYTAATASLLFVLFSGSVSYAYYKPTASVVVNINPSIELKTNRWDKIIKTTPLNDDGKKILDSLNIKNKSLDDGLDLIVDEAVKDNFINEDYIESGKVITISIENNIPNKDINLSSFEEHAKSNNLKVMIKKSKSQIQNESKQSDTKSSNSNSNKNNNSDNDSKDDLKNKENNKPNNPNNNSTNKNKENNKINNSSPALKKDNNEEDKKTYKFYKRFNNQNRNDKKQQNDKNNPKKD